MAILRKLLAGIGIASVGLLPLVGCSRNSVDHGRNAAITENKDAGVIQSDFERMLQENGIILAEKNEKFEGMVNMPLKDNYMLFYKPVQFNGESNGKELSPAVSDNAEILWLVFGNKIKVTEKLHPGDGIAELCAVPLGKNIESIKSDKREFTAGETPAHYELDKENYKITVDDDFINLSNNYSGVYFGADNLTELRKGGISRVSPGIYELIDPLVNGKDSLTSISMLNENEVKKSAPDNPNNLPFVALMYTTSSEIPGISQYLSPAKSVPETQEKSESQDSGNYYTIEQPAQKDSVEDIVNNSEELNQRNNVPRSLESRTDSVQNTGAGNSKDLGDYPSDWKGDKVTIVTNNELRSIISEDAKKVAKDFMITGYDFDGDGKDEIACITLGYNNSDSVYLFTAKQYNAGWKEEKEIKMPFDMSINPGIVATTYVNTLSSEPAEEQKKKNWTINVSGYCYDSNLEFK